MNARRDVTLLAALALCTGAEAIAESADSTATAGDAGLSEVVVTGTKMGETQVQSTPIAISAFSADDLARSSVTNVKDLAGYVPNLSISQSTTYALIFVRGIG